MFLVLGSRTPRYTGGLAARAPVVRVASPIVSSLSVQESRQLAADAPLDGSWRLRTLLQSEAMPSRVKSLAGVEAVLWTQQALPTLARRDAPVRRQERVRPPRKGTLPWGEARKDDQMVFVLDRHKQPLMPCTPKRARLLLARGRAVVHRVQPFVIRLKDRRVGDSIVQPLALKVDPGSKTTGIALARVEQTEEGAIHHGVFLAEVSHRGEQVHEHKVRQRNARRRRRCANLRYRAPRCANRRL